MYTQIFVLGEAFICFTWDFFYGVKFMSKMKFSHFGSIVMVIAAVAVMIVRPFEPDDTAHFMLGGILITLCIWIFKPLGLSYAVGGLFLALYALMLGISTDIVFSGFTQAALWTLIPAFFFGYALQKTGLGKRIALTIIKLFKPTYPSLVFAWVLIGAALSVLAPSTTVRIAIIMPIAVQCCELCKIKAGSKGNSLILLTAFAMALIPGSGWYTGIILGVFIHGLMEATYGLEGIVTFNSWFITVFPHVAISTVLLIFGGLFILKPNEKISEEAINAIKNEPLDKMSRNEKIASGILVAIFILFITGGLHGVPIAMLCIAALLAFFIFGILESKEFNTGANWDLIIFLAMTLSLGPILTAAGIMDWLAALIVPALAPIAGNPWIFMFGITIIMFLWRFVDVAMSLPTVAIMIPILPAIYETYGISPLAWLPVFVMTSNAFFLAYQNMWAMMSTAMAGERAWSDKDLGIYGMLYFGACMIALVVAIPLWISQGLF